MKLNLGDILYDDENVGILIKRDKFDRFQIKWNLKDHRSCWWTSRLILDKIQTNELKHQPKKNT